jgi:hypothetical protein
MAPRTKAEGTIMNTLGKLFKDLVPTYARMIIAYPQPKPVTVAQWALEAGWGIFSPANGPLQFRWLEGATGDQKLCYPGLIQTYA